MLTSKKSWTHTQINDKIYSKFLAMPTFTKTA